MRSNIAAAALAAIAALASPAGPAAAGDDVRPGLPERPTYWGGFDGFGRFGDDHGYRGFGLDQTFRGEGRSWTNRDTSVAAGTVGLGYGLSMGPYQGSFVEGFGYPDGGGRSRAAIPNAPRPGAWP